MAVTTTPTTMQVNILPTVFRYTCILSGLSDADGMGLSYRCGCPRLACWRIIAVNNSQTRTFKHIENASFRDPVTDAALFPAGVPLPKLPAVTHLDVDRTNVPVRQPSLSFRKAVLYPIELRVRSSRKSTRRRRASHPARLSTLAVGPLPVQTWQKFSSSRSRCQLRQLGREGSR